MTLLQNIKEWFAQIAQSGVAKPPPDEVEPMGRDTTKRPMNFPDKRDPPDQQDRMH